MTSSIQTIPLLNLAIAFVPVLAGLIILYRWSLDAGNALYAVARMLVQLLLIGYLLAYLFRSDSAWLIFLVLLIMVTASAWISLSSIKIKPPGLYGYALAAIALGGGLSLALVTQPVLRLDPWYWPQYMIPLAGMVFANSMNSVSLAAERFYAERAREADYLSARNAAFHASMIPVINSLFAVGLVSLPGMMTGQILSGVSPLIAVRYQIMVMCMIFGSSAITTACFLIWLRPSVQNE